MGRIKYRADIDGIRALAILLVVLYHAGFDVISGGFIGVDIFLVISGFLITSILYADINSGDFSYREFYKRRVKRLLPAYMLVSLFTTIATFYILLPQDLKFYSASLGSSYLGLSNVFFSMLSTGYFTPRMELFPLLHTWSLAVEEQFYIIWPTLLLLMCRYSGKYLLLLILVSIILFVIISIEGVISNPNGAYYLIQYRAFELLIGSYLALAWKYLPEMTINMKHIISVLALFLLLALGFNLDSNSVFPGYNALYVCIATAALIYTGKGEQGIVNKIFSWRPIVGIGLISYSLYLWHWPLISLMRYRQIEFTPIISVLVVCISIFLAWFTWKFIEIPTRRNIPLGFKRTMLRYYLFPVFIATLFIGGVYILNGIPQRYNKDNLELVLSYENEIDLSRDCSIRGSIDYKEKNISYEYLSLRCSFGESSSMRPEVLLFGDSHANHFKPFVDVLAKETKLSASYNIQGSCSAIRGVGDLDDNSVCAVRNRKLLSDSSKYNYVILAGAWTSQENIKNFRRDLMASVEKVIALNAVPIIFIDAPVSQIDIAKCPINNRLGWTDIACDIPVAEVYQMHHVYDEIIKNLRVVYPQLRIINPKKLLCNEVSCVTQIGNSALYRDADHINEIASRLLAKKWIQIYGNPLDSF